MFNDEGKGSPLIRVRDVNSGISGTYTTQIADEKYLIQSGDCIAGMDGNFRIVQWNYEDAYLNQRACKFTEKDVNKGFMRYFLGEKLLEIENGANSTTVKHLSAKDINNMLMPIPEKSVQTYFGELLEQTDKSKFIEMIWVPFTEECIPNGKFGDFTLEMLKG